MTYTDSESIRYNPDGSKTVTTIFTEMPDSKSKKFFFLVKTIVFLGSIVVPPMLTYWDDVKDRKRHRKAIEEIAATQGVKIEN